MPTQREVCTLTDGVPSCDTGPAGVYGSSSPNCVMWSASCAGRCTGARTGLASIRAVLRHGEVGSLAEKNLAGRVHSGFAPERPKSRRSPCRRGCS